MEESIELQQELERAKESLKDVDDNIKKITGRDPSEFRFGAFQGRRFVPPTGGPNERGFGRFPGFGNRRDLTTDGAPPQKRSAYSRLGFRSDRRRSRDDESPEDDDAPSKPTIQSSVVAYPKEQKTRKDYIEEQKPEAKGQARNRRMFGLLLGTLQKFRTEEDVKKDKEQKRVEIEKKLEENAEKERELLKKERKELFLERRKRHAQLKRLEYKMDLVKQLDEWEAHHKLLLNFIKTKTKPQICYLPAKHNDVSRQRLKESRKAIEESIAERRSVIEEEIRSMGKRRDVAAGEGADAEEGRMREGDPDDFVQAGDSQAGAMGEEDDGEPNFDESKENFPMLIPVGNQHSEEMEGATTGDEPVSEGVLLSTDNAFDTSLVEGPAMPPPSRLKVENDEDVVTDAKTETMDVSIDESGDQDLDPISLAEKEFEPIYD